jgi:hypothetical protein
MRQNFPPIVELNRISTGTFSTQTGDMYGAFAINGPRGELLKIIAYSGVNWPFDPPAWEHVSVSLPRRCPTWEEMDFVKNLFFGEDECVIQFHPPRKDWINHHPFCLHLWKPVGVEIIRPPTETIGPKH